MLIISNSPVILPKTKQKNEKQQIENLKSKNDEKRTQARGAAKQPARRSSPLLT